eukprot:4752867-Amphidinium_carterae.1
MASWADITLSSQAGAARTRVVPTCQVRVVQDYIDFEPADLATYVCVCCTASEEQSASPEPPCAPDTRCAKTAQPGYNNNYYINNSKNNKKL